MCHTRAVTVPDSSVGMRYEWSYVWPCAGKNQAWVSVVMRVCVPAVTVV